MALRALNETGSNWRHEPRSETSYWAVTRDKVRHSRNVYLTAEASVALVPKFGIRMNPPILVFRLLLLQMRLL
jgi:hypothetical protein